MEEINVVLKDCPIEVVHVCAKFLSQWLPAVNALGITMKQLSKVSCEHSDLKYLFVR